MKTILVFALMSVAALQSWALESLTGKVVSVIDGNTMEVRTSENELYKIVLAGIDSPELSQQYGDKARKLLERLAGNKEVTMDLKGKDRWGNYIALVLVEGEDPRIALLKEGLAWTSEKNPSPELENYRITAQEKGKGLWKEDNPTPPWTYRRQQSMMEPKSR